MIHRWYWIDQPWFWGYIIMICTLLRHLRLSEQWACHILFLIVSPLHKSKIYLLSCICDCCCWKQYWTSEMFVYFHNFESEQDVCLKQQSCSQFKLLRKTGDASSCSMQCARAPDEPTLDVYLHSSITHIWRWNVLGSLVVWYIAYFMAIFWVHVGAKYRFPFRLINCKHTCICNFYVCIVAYWCHRGTK